MLFLTNNVGDPQKLIDMKFSIYSYIKMKYFALKMRFEGVKKKVDNACDYVIQKLSMIFFPNIDSINVFFKEGKIYFINN